MTLSNLRQHELATNSVFQQNTLLSPFQCRTLFVSKAKCIIIVSIIVSVTLIFSICSLFLLPSRFTSLRPSSSNGQFSHQPLQNLFCSNETPNRDDCESNENGYADNRLSQCKTALTNYITSNNEVQNTVSPPSPNSNSSATENSSPTVPLTLQRYIQWHAQARRCFFDQRAKASKECEDFVRVYGVNGKLGVLVWRCGSWQTCPGVGDRIRGIDSLFLLAMVTFRLFLIDYTVPNANVVPLAVAIRPAMINWTIPVVTSASTHRLRRRNGESVQTNVDYNIHLKWSNPGDIHRLPTVYGAGTYFDPFHDSPTNAFGNVSVISVASNLGRNVFAALRQNEYVVKKTPDMSPSHLSDLEVARVYAQTLFRPTPYIDFLINRLINPIGPRFIAIHIRTGAQLGESNIPRFAHLREPSQVSLSLLQCAVNVTKHLNDSVSYGLLVSGDDNQVKQFIKKQAPQYGFNDIVLAMQPTHVISSHVDFDLILTPRFVRTCVEFQNVFVDLIALSRASAIVSTGSGFARAAFVWGNSFSLHFAFSSRGSPICSPLPIR